ncbi:aldehyde dehydrogenase family protein [Microbacterium pseudoresistens]|nr:aldehyde dehydrogenase family protein [Microbacterium pseudoresistens]
MRDQGLYIGGEWVSPRSTREAVDAWTGEVTGTVAVAAAGDARAAVDAAADALGAPLSPERRAQILSTTADLIEHRAEEFAQSIRAEVNKPITAARTEVARAIGTLRLSAAEAQRLPGEAVPLDAVDAGLGTIALTRPEPRGVVAAISPFNFPLNLVVHKVGPALAAGCAVVLKPTDRAPFTAGLLIDALHEAGLPAGWINLVTGPAEIVVGAWQEDPRVEVVTFTGSSRIGWKLKADSPKKLHVLELGSNTAMYVDRSADLDRAVEATVAAGFANSGQACVSLQRVYAHDDVFDDVVARITAAAAAVPYGDPRDSETVVGPLISASDTERLVGWIGEAVSRGATVLAGGDVRNGVLAPTVIRDVPTDSALVCEEVFGPVVSLVSVASMDEALLRINDSDYGLNTSVFTADLAAALDFSARVQSGSALVNMPPSFRADHMPYGGVKDSGQGREGVRYAVAELVREKLIILKA